MTAGYPGTVWNPATVTEITAAEYERTLEELEAVMNTLGTNPQGTQASLRHRLDNAIASGGACLYPRFVQADDPSSAVDTSAYTRRFRVYPLWPFFAESAGYSFTLLDTHGFGTQPRNFYHYECTFSPPDAALTASSLGTQEATVFLNMGDANPYGGFTIVDRFHTSQTSFRIISEFTSSELASTSLMNSVALIFERFPTTAADSLEIHGPSAARLVDSHVMLAGSSDRLASSADEPVKLQGSS